MGTLLYLAAHCGWRPGGITTPWAPRLTRLHGGRRTRSKSRSSCPALVSSPSLPPSLPFSLPLSLARSLAGAEARQRMRRVLRVLRVLRVWLISVYAGGDLEGYVWVRGKVWNAVEDGEGKLEVELLVNDDTPISVKGMPMFHLRKIPVPVAKKAKIVTVSSF